LVELVTEPDVDGAVQTTAAERMTLRFDEFYVRSLRLAYDAERQLADVLPRWVQHHPMAPCEAVLMRLAREAGEQLRRLETVFRELYQQPRAEPCWPVSALLREAEEYSELGSDEFACCGVAASLLAIKRLQITRYEALMAWSIQCGLDEAVPLLRRALAEALVAAEALGTLAFGMPERPTRHVPASRDTGETV
jgi:ferritin-like metal-binding protein YciE